MNSFLSKCIALVLSFSSFLPLYAQRAQRKLPEFLDLAASFSHSRSRLEEAAIDSFVFSTDIITKTDQLFLVSLPQGFTVENATEAPGGYLFFGFNVPQDAVSLVTQNISIKNGFAKNGFIPPYYSLDCEGGYVNRLSGIGSPFPPPLRVSNTVSPEAASEFFDIYSREMRSLGFDVNLAPVIEPCNEYNREFLDTRSFGDSQKSFDYSLSYISAMQRNQILPVVKHFPGNTNDDPHSGLPVLDLDPALFYKEFLEPFYRVFETGSKGEQLGVLVAHTVVPHIDETPFCLSEKGVRTLTQDGEPFPGLVFSDDLLMSALKSTGLTTEEAIVEAVRAGVTVVMVSEANWIPYRDYLVQAAAEDVSLSARIDDAFRKIAEYKCSAGLLSYRYSLSQNQQLSCSVRTMPVLSFEEMDVLVSGMVIDFEDAYRTGVDFYNRWFR